MKFLVRGTLISLFISGILLSGFCCLQPRQTAKSDFACAVNCMDGRTQDAVKNYIKENYGVNFVDMVTEAGPNKILAENSNDTIVENIKKRVEISVHHHGSKVIVIVGHAKCAGNPVSKEEQISHLRQSKKIVEGFGFDTKVILLWVDENWKANKIE